MGKSDASRKNEYLYKKVFDHIEGMIRRGELEVGRRIPSERTLAETCKVSRNCVRQAIQALSDRRILESRRGAGTYVCEPDETAVIDSFGSAINARKELIREILEFRLLMEPQIAALAARNITPEELDRLKIIICDQERKILAGREDSELDSAFHQGLAAASKNRIVRQVIDTVNCILNESRSESLWSEARRRASVIGHLKIVDALENRDSEMAYSAMKEHLWSVERIILGDETPMSSEQ